LHDVARYGVFRGGGAVLVLLRAARRQEDAKAANRDSGQGETGPKSEAAGIYLDLILRK
jgi:hypothetical protein